MNIEEIRKFCLELPHTSEDFPFDQDTLALRVGGKIFALVPLEKGGQMNLKCDPERAIELREQYEAIQPGYHMNKAMWNTIHFDQLSPKLVNELIVHSYELIFASLTRKKKQELLQS